MRTIMLAAITFATATLLSLPASAGVLYDNGPINAQVNNLTTALYLHDQSVADSFTLLTNSVVGGVTFGAWVDFGDTPASVDWSITQVTGADLVPFDYPSIASGTAALTNTVYCLGTGNPSCAAGHADVYTSSFTLPNIALTAGTYYLILTGGTSASPNGELNWDDNNGPSDAWVTHPGLTTDMAFYGGSNSESFQILGPAQATPEPYSFVPLAATLGVLVFLLRRKRA